MYVSTATSNTRTNTLRHLLKRHQGDVSETGRDLVFRSVMHVMALRLSWLTTARQHNLTVYVPRSSLFLPSSSLGGAETKRLQHPPLSLVRPTRAEAPAAVATLNAKAAVQLSARRERRGRCSRSDSLNRRRERSNPRRRGRHRRSECAQAFGQDG